MNLFPGHIVYDSENTYEILSFKNRENANVRNLETGEKKTILVKDIVEKYALLNPVGYIGFNIVDLKANLQDVIVSLFKPEDLEETPAIPYAICRQCIVDFIYQQIDPKSEMLGISVSKDTCPANVDFSYMLSCDKVHSGTMIAVYLDYDLDKILSFIKTKDFDNTLYATMMDYAKHQSDKFGNFMYNNIINQDCYNGYCKSLKILLETNAKTVTELNENWLKTALIVLKSVKSLDEQTKKAVNSTLNSLKTSTKKWFIKYNSKNKLSNNLK